VFDTAFNDSLGYLYGHADPVNCCAFSADGMWIVSGSDDHTVKVWSAASFREASEALRAVRNRGVLSLGDDLSPVICIALAPDGKKIISAHDDHTLKVWDAVSGSPISCLIGHEDTIRSCAWSPDGRAVVSGGEDRILTLWKLDALGKSSSSVILGELGAAVLSCSFSPDGRSIVAETDDDVFNIWDTASGQLRAILDASDVLDARPPAEYGTLDIVVVEHILADRTRRRSYAWNPTKAEIATLHEDCNVRLWDTESGRLKKILRGHTRKVNRCVFSPDGTLVASVSNDRTIRIWEARSGKPLRTMLGHTDGVRCCGFDSSGRRIVSASDDKTLRVWDVSRGKSTMVLAGHAKAATFGVVSPSDDWIVSGGGDGTLRLWHAESGVPAQTLYDCGDDPFAGTVAVAPDESYVAYVDTRHRLRLWGSGSGLGQAISACQPISNTESRPRPGMRHAGLIRSCSFSPGGERLVSVGDDGAIRLWDVERCVEERAFTGHDDDGGLLSLIACCSFAPDGRRIATGGTDGTIRFWDVDGKRPPRVVGEGGDHKPRGEEDRRRAPGVWSLSYAPNGETLVEGTESGELTIRNAKSGRVVKEVSFRAGGLYWCGFSPDGKRIAAIPGKLKAFYVVDPNRRPAKYGEPERGLVGYWGHEKRVNCCAWSPDGKSILSASDDRTLRVWDVSSGQSIRTLVGHSDIVRSCAFLSDGRHAVSAGDDGTLRLWDCQQGSEEGMYWLWGDGMCSAASQCGGRFCCGDSNGNVYVLELEGCLS
jgi:WD40 repeat protein